MRKILLALAALGAAAFALPEPAFARGFHGGGFHGGGFHGGGFHGGGFRYGSGFRGGYGGYRGRGFGYGAVGLGLGIGLGSYYGGFYSPPYYASGYYGGDCYVARRQVWTPYGWRLRPVRVCG